MIFKGSGPGRNLESGRPVFLLPEFRRSSAEALSACPRSGINRNPVRLHRVVAFADETQLRICDRVITAVRDAACADVMRRQSGCSRNEKAPNVTAATT